MYMAACSRHCLRRGTGVVRGEVQCGWQRQSREVICPHRCRVDYSRVQQQPTLEYKQRKIVKDKKGKGKEKHSKTIHTITGSLQN